MSIAILALQGAFEEHAQMLQKISVDSVFIRNLADWQAYISATDGNRALIIPGGESTAMMRIIRDENLFEPIREAIISGLPVFGTCAGMIMLDDLHLNVMDIHAKRNAYGRQLGSFSTDHEVEGIGRIPMTFIRAPYIESIGPDAKVLSVLDGNIICAQQGKMLVCSFHPELTQDERMHRYFVEMVKKSE
ncbi:MAG: pyridoxal 5'-phosphate synthase glutaminase subunit PdxT [Salinivirgaceae bacterium]|nr:pyridoxal 5'-phosphate synthase glutaminase subunit PdxT [Salinivirgaceae bacterium]